MSIFVVLSRHPLFYSVKLIRESVTALFWSKPSGRMLDFHKEDQGSIFLKVVANKIKGASEVLLKLLGYLSEVSTNIIVAH